MKISIRLVLNDDSIMSRSALDDNVGKDVSVGGSKGVIEAVKVSEDGKTADIIIDFEMNPGE